MILKCALLFNVLTSYVCGQQFPTMPEPLFPKEVGYVGDLPSLEVEKGVRGVNNLMLSRESLNPLITGSAPRARMIILSEVAQALDGDVNLRPETVGTVTVYLQEKDSIWNYSRRFLEKLYPPPPPVKNPAVFEKAYEISKYNKIKVPAWKLDGKILDTKMPKGYRFFVAP